ncbi:MAG: O-acetyl-ADP-ribose deacetylase [Spirochaetota bacterium]
MSLSEKISEKIHIVQGDIILMNTDAIVNAANTSLCGGGGVDGAIHKAAGPSLLQECRLFGGCKTGEARLTQGYDLKAHYIIHTPGPVYKNGNQKEPELLASCYTSSMIKAEEKSLKSISFPAISTGVYGYPKKEAALIALRTVFSFMKEKNYYPDVFFVLFDRETFNLYQQAFKSIVSGTEI